MPYVDVQIRNEGAIFLFTPRTNRAEDWIKEKVQSDAQFFGDSLAVAHGYARDIADAMINDGLVVE